MHAGDDGASGGAAVREAAGRLLPSSGGLPHVDESAVAVLLLDTSAGTVTYANPAALALTEGRAQLPAAVADWSVAARLVVPAPGAPDGDPVAAVAAGGTVTGAQVSVRDDEGVERAYWATGSPLLSGDGTAGSAIIALLPVREPALPPSGSAPGTAAGAAVEAVSAALAGADGAALARADGSARAAVHTEALLEGGGDGSPGTGHSARDVDELTARALLASSISFSISDPRREDDPLVWVNPAFERMTGYTAGEVIGRNCRFLQGPGTDRDEVRRLATALDAQDSVRAELLNYRADGTAFWNSLAVSPVLDGQGRLTHFVGVQTDVTARVLAGLEHDRLLAAEREARHAAESAQARLDVLVRLGEALGETLDVDQALRRLVDSVVPELVDFCVADVFDGSQGVSTDLPAEALLARRRRVAVAHADPARAALLERAGELDLLVPEASLVPRAVRAGEPVVMSRPGEDDRAARAGGNPEMVELLRRLDARSVAVVPLLARGRVIGAITLGTTGASDRTLDEGDQGLLQGIGARAALAVDNARLFAAESAQRRQADALAAAGESLAASLRSGEVVGVLLDRVVPAVADAAFVHLDEGAPPSLRPPGTPPGLHPAAVRAADPARQADVEALVARLDVGAGRPGTGAAWSTNTPQIVPSVADLVGTAGPDAAVQDLAVQAGVAVPLTVRGTTLGVLTLVRTSSRPYSTTELHFVAELGRRGALALENARLYEGERFVALELQRSLLPARLPNVPDLEVAGRYLAGAAGTEVGGDWYDVVPLPDGAVAVAVGDVMGRGVRAAAVMGQMRAALRSYAVEGLGPGQILHRLAAFTDILEGEHLVTCLVGIHDAASGTVTLASAGHPPPLLLDAEGSAALVDVDPGLPLGVPDAEDLVVALDGGARGGGDVLPEPRYPHTEVKLHPGSTLLLFTDGLVEDRDVPVGDGLAVLARTLDGVPADSAEDACDDALRAMGRDTSHDDDTAILALRAVAPAPAATDRRIDLQPDLRAPGRARRFVRAVLTEHGLEEQADSAELLTSELVTNALRHGDQPAELAVQVDAGEATVAVRDGSSEPPVPRDHDGPGATRVIEGGLEEGGRGLLLVRSVAHDWGWQVLPDGKRVWFRLRSGPDAGADATAEARGGTD